MNRGFHLCLVIYVIGDIICCSCLECSSIIWFIVSFCNAYTHLLYCSLQYTYILVLLFLWLVVCWVGMGYLTLVSIHIHLLFDCWSGCLERLRAIFCFAGESVRVVIMIWLSCFYLDWVFGGLIEVSLPVRRVDHRYRDQWWNRGWYIDMYCWGARHTS